MRIKTKLRLNVIVVLLVVGAVVATSVLSMGAVRNRLSFLTQRSAPFQMRTAEMQGALQHVALELLEMSESRNLGEYRLELKHSEDAIAEIRQKQDALNALTGESGSDIAGDVKKSARELFTITESRLLAESETVKGNQVFVGNLVDISARLKELENRTRRLQGARSTGFVASLQDTRTSSTRLRGIETFKIALKELLYTIDEIQKASDRKGVLVARSRYSVALGKAQQTEYLKSSRKVGEEMKKLADRVDELVRLKNATSIDSQATVRINELNEELGEKTTLIMLVLDQEVNAFRERYSKESDRQGASFTSSTLATEVLIDNSELMASGLTLEILATHLSHAETAKAVDELQMSITRTFERAGALQKRLEGLLGKLGAQNELGLLRSAGAALKSNHQSLLAANGVIAKVRHTISLREEAEKVNTRLKTIIEAQSSKGREAVSAAQSSQEKAIGAVNTLSRTSIVAIVIMGCIALVFGLIFSVTLERSIVTPIRELKGLAERFGSGDFSQRLDDRRSDEFGELSGHFNQASEKLCETARQMTVTITRLAAHSSQLSGTAEGLSKGARKQSAQTEQSALALTEMSQSINEVAGNAGAAADATRQTNDIAASGSEVVDRTVTGMEKISIAVQDTAAHIRELGAGSEQIGSIVDSINDIADQTNLLALNAAIEAARAGEMGRGFAVVADEVRKLAQRTMEATSEIATMIRAIQEVTARSVAAMEIGHASVEDGVRLAGEARHSLDAIVEASSRGAEMVFRIATASEQQSATAQQVTASVASIAEITRETESSMDEINNSSAELARIAKELSNVSAWFKVEGA